MAEEREPNTSAAAEEQEPNTSASQEPNTGAASESGAEGDEPPQQDGAIMEF